MRVCNYIMKCHFLSTWNGNETAGRDRERDSVALQQSLAPNKQLFTKQMIYLHPCENSRRTLFTRKLLKRPHDNVTRERFSCRAFPWVSLPLKGTHMLMLLFVVSSPQLSLAVRVFLGHDNRTCIVILHFIPWVLCSWILKQNNRNGTKLVIKWANCLCDATWRTVLSFNAVQKYDTTQYNNIHGTDGQFLK